MVEIPLVCGKWKFAKNKWSFIVDERRGCRVLSAKAGSSFDDFLAMVYEDFGFDRKVYEVKLSYKLHTMNFIVIPEDTPPVIVCNRRQLEGFIRQCNSEFVGRLCVQIEEYETGKYIFGPDASPEKTESNEEQYYKSKAAGKQPIYACSMEGEAYLEGEEQKGEDEDEIYRFDCCDDSDGASSGDEDYGMSYKLSDEETDDEDEADEEKLEVEEEENAEEAAVKDEEDEEMVDVQKKEENRIVPIGKRVSITAKEYVQLLSGGVAIAVGQKYESKFQLVIRMKIISVLQQFDFVVSRSTPWVYAIKCWVKGCKWRVRATPIDASGNFHIKVYVNQHTCSVTERSARCRQATKDILAVLYKNFVGGVGPGVLPNHVSEALKLRYGIKVKSIY